MCDSLEKIFFVHPEAIAFGVGVCFTRDLFILLVQRKIAKMRRPISVKFCTVINTRPNFIMPVQNSGGLPPKNFKGQKHAKFGFISEDFKVW